MSYLNYNINRHFGKFMTEDIGHFSVCDMDTGRMPVIHKKLRLLRFARNDREEFQGNDLFSFVTARPKAAAVSLQ